MTDDFMTENLKTQMFNFESGLKIFKNEIMAKRKHNSS